jgi:hypothetical protein
MHSWESQRLGSAARLGSAVFREFLSQKVHAFIPPEGQAFGSHVFCSQSRTVLFTIFPTSTLHMLVYSPTHNYRTSFSSLLDQLAKRTQRIILWFSVCVYFNTTEYCNYNPNHNNRTCLVRLLTEDTLLRRTDYES